jgi:hypothetical protein
MAMTVPQMTLLKKPSIPPQNLLTITHPYATAAYITQVPTLLTPPGDDTPFGTWYIDTGFVGATHLSPSSPVAITNGDVPVVETITADPRWFRVLGSFVSGRSIQICTAINLWPFWSGMPFGTELAKVPLTFSADVITSLKNVSVGIGVFALGIPLDEIYKKNAVHPGDGQSHRLTIVGRHNNVALNQFLMVWVNAEDIPMSNSILEFQMTVTYTLGNLVIDGCGNVYQSISSGNVGNEPSSSPTKWSLVSVNTNTPALELFRFTNAKLSFGAYDCLPYV